MLKAALSILVLIGMSLLFSPRVVGSGGSGKSTVAAQLGELLNPEVNQVKEFLASHKKAQTAQNG